MTAPRLTPAMVAALRLAAEGPITGYVAGCYGCVDAELLAHELIGAYHERWTITQAGRDALAAIDAETNK